MPLKHISIPARALAEAKAMNVGCFTLSDNNYDNARTPNELLQHIMEGAIRRRRVGFSFRLDRRAPFQPVWRVSIAPALSGESRGAHPPTAVSAGRDPIALPSPTAGRRGVCTPLDLLSEGRVDVAAGRGYGRREYEAFGAPFERSADIFREGLDIVRRAWTEGSFACDGQFYHIPDVSVSAPPVQQPHPPIYVACFSKPTTAMAVTSGFNIIFAPSAAAMMFGSIQEATTRFKDMAAANGRPDSGGMCSYFVHVCQDRREEQTAKEALIRYFRSILSAFPSDPATTPSHLAYFLDLVKCLQAMRPEDLTSKSMIFGEPDYCIEHLRQLAAAGIREVILYFNFDCRHHQAVMQNMRVFAREVLPHISVSLAASLSC